MIRLVTSATAARALPWFGFYAGALTLAAAYAYAATQLTGQVHFHLFWLGMALFVVPAGLRLGHASVRRGERLALLAALALFDALPKFLRSPDHLLFYDELAHYRQTQITIATGRLFEPNPLVPIVRVYPGLHALTAMLAGMSGLTTLQLAILLLGLLHVAALFGVFALAEALGHSARVAALAALLYSLNPGFLFFDTMYAYESLAIVFFIWALVALVHVDASLQADERIGWFVVALLCGFACTVTHHASSYVLCATALAMTVVGAARWRRGDEYRWRAGASAACTLSLLVAILAWTIGVAHEVVTYLGPLAAAFVASAVGLVQPHAAHRQLFAGSTAPSYEHVAAFVSPALAAIGALAGLRLLRISGRRRSSPELALYGLALLYFLSLPFLFTQGGNEVARRSWSFTYLGLALLVAPALPRIARGRAPVRALTVTSLLFVVLVGNTAMNTNETYRFPGAVIYGSDTRTLTDEVLDTVRWFRATFGAGRLVIADRANGPAFAALGEATTAPAWRGLPIWQLYLSSRPPDASLLRALQVGGYQFLVIDRRMLSALPKIGFYVTKGEPASDDLRPPPPAALDRYERRPWAIKIYQSDHLAVYRLDFAARSLRWGAPPSATRTRPVPTGADAASPPGRA